MSEKGGFPTGPLLSSGLFRVSFLMFAVVLIIFGPANLAAFFKSPQVYTIIIALIIGIYIVRNV